MGKLAALAVLVLLALAAAAQAHPEPNDVDGDGVVNAQDNCFDVRNGDQRDVDADGRGDKCDPDADNDTLANESDNCRLVANADQVDTDGDGIGDVCDKDSDLDGIQDVSDNCFDVPNPDQRNNDRADDGGDICDPDDDDDGVFDVRDNCVFTYNWEQVDADGDGLGALCDADDAPKRAGAPPAAPDTTAPAVRLSLASRHRFAAVRGGLVVGVRCSEACAVTAELRIDRKSARRAGLRANAAVARGAAQVERAASTYAFVRFSRGVRRKLERSGRMSGTLRVTAVDRAGNRRKLRRAVRISR
jgi:hypothetical protein